MGLLAYDDGIKICGFPVLIPSQRKTLIIIAFQNLKKMTKIIFFLTTIIATSFVSKAQDCKQFFPTEVGKKIEVTEYDKKSKETSRTVRTVTDYQTSGTNATVSFKDVYYSLPVDTEVSTREYTIKCEDGIFYADPMVYTKNESTAQYEGFETKVETENVTIPANVKPGDALPDGKVVATIITPGMPITITVDLTNRKVEANETITTSAGTFDCLKITYDVSLKMLLTFRSKAAQWYADGVGLVKTENYNKKGKLVSFSQVTKIY